MILAPRGLSPTRHAHATPAQKMAQRLANCLAGPGLRQKHNNDDDPAVNTTLAKQVAGFEGGGKAEAVYMHVNWFIMLEVRYIVASAGVSARATDQNNWVGVRANYAADEGGASQGILHDRTPHQQIVSALSEASAICTNTAGAGRHSSIAPFRQVGLNDMFGARLYSCLFVVLAQNSR